MMAANQPYWGICPKLRACTQAATAVLLIFLVSAARLDAGTTEPRLALMRVTPYGSAGGSRTLQLEGSFSFGDTVQLALPLNVVVSQGTLTARFDLAGNVFTSIGGAAELPAPGLGIVRVAQRQIVLVLPAGFVAGNATAQVVADFEQRPISSNRLGFTL